MLRIIIILVIISLTSSCSKGLMDGNIDKNMAELDKIYGKCNNPYRTFSKAQKKICEDKERAAGADGIVGESLNITEMIENYRNGGKTVYASSAVNSYLWNASMIIVEPYTLKIADSQGGVISTEWIKNKNEPNERCSIKININSQELLSNGVNAKLICEEKIQEEWFPDNINYSKDEKQMVLRILEIAYNLEAQDQISK